MPGSIPSLANSRKQMRQRLKSRIKAFPRPQRKQRFFFRVLNFAFFCDLATTDFFAINKVGDPPSNITFASSFPQSLEENKEKNGLTRI